MIYWPVFDRLMYTAFVGDADVVAEAKRQVLRAAISCGRTAIICKRIGIVRVRITGLFVR